MRISPKRNYPTIEEINKEISKPLIIDEDWITNKAQQKQDRENFKNIRKSKIFR